MQQLGMWLYYSHLSEVSERFVSVNQEICPSYATRGMWHRLNGCLCTVWLS